jgi:hypothetical protein
MKKFIILFLALSFQKLLSQHQNNYLIGINIHKTFTFWENYSKDYDDLGLSINYKPEFEVNCDKYLIRIEYLFGKQKFVGPNDLTKTWPDDDIDVGFNSKMNRNEMSLSLGYIINESLRCYLQIQNIGMEINGILNQYFENQLNHFSYIEKGILIGPLIKYDYPTYKSRSFLSTSFSYLIGNLDYDYKTHRIKVREKNIIETQSLSFEIGYNYNIYQNLFLGIYLDSNYLFKYKYFYDHKFSSNIWFYGINGNIEFVL